MAPFSSDYTQKFRNALIQLILTGISSPDNFDLHGIPAAFFQSITTPLLPLIDWRLDIKVSSPKKEECKRILRWIRQRLQNVLDEKVGEEAEKCEFTLEAVKTEVERLLEYPGALTFSRILYEHRDNPEYQDAFKSFDHGNNTSMFSAESSSYVVIGDTSAFQDPDSSFLVFPKLDQ